jgi:hypothetical protein
MVAVACIPVWCVLLGNSITVEGIGGMDLLTNHDILSIGLNAPCCSKFPGIYLDKEVYCMHL